MKKARGTMSGISDVIAVIDKMEADGVISRYAIGGAVGATFYLEPVATVDVDIFIVFRPESSGKLISLKPIYDYLTARGGIIEGEYVVITGWPVQFLPPASALVEEALAEAVSVNVDEKPARVFTAEHLAAIALQTGRPKDKARLLQFIEAGALDRKRLGAILDRHGLTKKWQEFERTFLPGKK